MSAPESPTPIHIRLATSADAPAVLAIYAPVVLETAVSFEWIPPDARAMEVRIDATLQRLPWLVALAEGDSPSPQIVGYAYATPHRSRAAYQWAVEVSVYVATNARRCGVARTLYGSLFRLLQKQHYRTAYAVIALPNAPSLRLHEVLEFERVGVFPAAGFKHGRWHDVLWMRRQLAPPSDQPEHPTPLPSLAAAAIASALDT